MMMIMMIMATKRPEPTFSIDTQRGIFSPPSEYYDYDDDDYDENYDDLDGDEDDYDDEYEKPSEAHL